MVKVNWQVAATGRSEAEYYHVVVRMVIFSNFSNNFFIIFSSLTKSSDMLNKNTLGVKKCEANQKPQWLYKRPKTLISSKAKKLNILLRIFSLE